MNRIEEQLKDLDTIRLPQEASSRMRAELLEYANLHSAEKVSETILHKKQSYSFFAFYPRVFTGVLALLVVVFGITGTVHAAENSLPGDVLYSLKVHVAEPIQTALIPDSHGKAAWYAIIAERRLNEAAQLAAQNRLSSTTQVELAANFTTNVDASEHAAAQLQKAGDTMGALSARSDLDARLVAHMQILNVIATHYSSASSTDTVQTSKSIKTLTQLVADREQHVANARLALEQSISPGIASSTAKVALTTRGTVGNSDTSHFSRAHIRDHFIHNGDPSVQVQIANAQHTQEVAHILQDNASLLAKFLPTASTTASTTIASTTASSTATSIENDTASSSDSVHVSTASSTRVQEETTSSSTTKILHVQSSIFAK